MTKLPSIRPPRFDVVALAALLLSSSVDCRGAPPPPQPSPLPVAACAQLRFVEADTDLVSLYARVADETAAGALGRDDYLQWDLPHAALQSGSDLRPATLNAIAVWLDRALQRQEWERHASFAALHDAFRRDEGAADFLVDLAGLFTETSAAFHSFRQSLQILADDLAFPVAGTPDGGRIGRLWQPDACAIRRRLDRLRKQWGCLAPTNGTNGKPNRPDRFDLDLALLDLPYVTWATLGLPQCESSNPSRPTDCVDLAQRKPFLPRCDEAVPTR